MITFEEYLNKQSILESEEYTLSEDQQALLDDAVAMFLAEGKSVEDLESELTNEGIFGSILGGLTGAALGKTVGEAIAKVLGINKGVLYDLLTSRLVAAALGAHIGNKF